MKKYIVLLASMGLATGVAAVEFADVDADGDGVISLEESIALPDLDFVGADVDGDGLLSVEEYDAATAVDEVAPEATDEVAPAADDPESVVDDVPAEDYVPLEEAPVE